MFWGVEFVAGFRFFIFSHPCCRLGLSLVGFDLSGTHTNVVGSTFYVFVFLCVVHAVRGMWEV